MWSMQRNPHEAGFLVGIVVHGPILEQCFWRILLCGEHPWRSSSWRTTACRKNPWWNSSWRTVSHGRNLTLEQGRSVRRKEWQTQNIMNWPQPPFYIPPSLIIEQERGRRVENKGLKLSLGRKSGVGENCVWFSLCFYPTLFFFNWE